MATVPVTPSRPALTGRWEVDPAHTTVEFRVRHAGLARVRGVFHEVEGVLGGAAGRALTGRGSIATASLDTRLRPRDEHLRSPDFFDVERFPRMELVATDIRVGARGEVSVDAELTIRDVTRPIRLEGELLGTGRDDDGIERVGLELSGRLDRRDFGLNWNAAIEGGGVLVGYRVDLDLEISAVRAS